MPVTKYHKGDVLTLIPANESVVVQHNTLKGGGVNAAEATVFVETSDGYPVAIPVAVQDRYLTTAPPKKDALVKGVTPKPGMIQRLFGPLMRSPKK